MRIPAVSLRRSKEAVSETTPLVSPDESSASKKRLSSSRSKSQRGLDKWENMLSEDEREFLASYPSSAGSQTEEHDPSEELRTCSPRWMEDHADPAAQKNRTAAQLGAMAALYFTSPTVFASC